MRTFCQIIDGIIVNRAVFDDTGLPDGWHDAGSWVESETARMGDTYASGVFTSPPALPSPPAPPPNFLAREFFALLSVADYTAIKSATANSDALGLLWDSLKAQGEAPIITTSERFLAGWAGLKVALGTKRSTEIAAALNIPNG